MAELKKDMEAYERLRQQLETEHFGKWVVIHNQKLVGVFQDFDSAANDAVQKFGRGPYHIRQVGDHLIELPASLLYRPVSG